jgi:hypothetical protein
VILGGMRLTQPGRLYPLTFFASISPPVDLFEISERTRLWNYEIAAPSRATEPHKILPRNENNQILK